MVAVRNTPATPHAVPDLRPSRHLQVVRAAPSGRRLHAVYRRRRLVAGLLVMLCALGVVGAVAPVLGDPAGAPVEAGGVHVVRPGDTYWSIASSLDTDGDIRATVDVLSAANDGRPLQVGDRLVLPG